MNKQYRREKFESREEAFCWVADNKPIYNSTGELSHESDHYKISAVSQLWQYWHKAIEIVPEKRLIEFWVNIYPDRIGAPQDSLRMAKEMAYENSICIVKLSKEITIIDGKVVRDEPNN